MKVVITESQFDSLFMGKKVKVYYNLQKHTFSVTYDEKVIIYADYVKMAEWLVLDPKSRLFGKMEIMQ